MTDLLQLLNYGLVLFYGAALSTSFSGGARSRRDRWCMGLLCIALLAAQTLCLQLLGLQRTRMLYPLLTHIPLWLMLWKGMERTPPVALVSVLTAYFCCQLPRWVGSLVQAMRGSELGYELAYSVSILGFGYLLCRYFAAPAFAAMTYSKRSLWIFGGLPLFYYLFDYAATVYSNALYLGIRGIIEFLPAAMALFYIFFVTIYHGEVQNRSQTELENSMLAMELDAAAQQVEAMEQSQAQAAVYRHDMRHHLNAISSYLSAGKPAEAQEYIHRVQADVGSFTPTRYCENELVNLLCSSFTGQARQAGVTLTIDARLPKSLPLSDTELCSILSNGLENALRAAGQVTEGPRWVDLYCGVRREKLLIEIKNPYAGAVPMENGMPVNHQAGHGFGCRSIAAIAQKWGGLCTFRAEEGAFSLQLAIPLA